MSKPLHLCLCNISNFMFSSIFFIRIGHLQLSYHTIHKYHSNNKMWNPNQSLEANAAGQLDWIYYKISSLPQVHPDHEQTASPLNSYITSITYSLIEQSFHYSCSYIPRALGTTNTELDLALIMDCHNCVSFVFDCLNLIVGIRLAFNVRPGLI